MAAKKKKKKPVKAVRKAKRAAPKKAARKASARRKAAAKQAPARKAVKAKKPVKKTKAKKKPARRAIGEGNYQASKRFRAGEEAFVKKNKAKIPALAKAAEAALEGPEGDSLRAAETEAAGHAAGEG